MTVAESRSLAEYFALQREKIDAALARYLPAAPPSPALIAEAMRYSVFPGGKRLRPILTLAAAEAVAGHADGSDRALGPCADRRVADLALPAACAIELIHTYSLIHDDLPSMDNDALRRGRPTLHVVHGEAIAILTGDGLLTEAFALLAREPPTDEDADLARRKLRAISVIAEAAGAAGMVGGQALDLQAAGAWGRRVEESEWPRPPHRAPPDHDAESLRAIHASKTGALIRAAAVTGAVMAGGTELLIAGIGDYGAELGLAFQIVDDILDVEGAAAVTGKTTGKDARAGKRTYPALYGMEQSRRLAADCIARARHALAAAGIARGWLVEIAEAIVARTN